MAAVDYQEEIEAYPQSSKSGNVYRRLGAVRSYIGEFDSAIDSFTKATHSNPTALNYAYLMDMLAGKKRLADRASNTTDSVRWEHILDNAIAEAKQAGIEDSDIKDKWNRVVIPDLMPHK